MTTTVKHKGTDKEVEVALCQCDKHKDVIIAYCDGAKVKVKRGDHNHWECSPIHSWATDKEYMVEEITPSHVYEFDGYVYLYVEGDKFVTIDNRHDTKRYLVARDYLLAGMTKIADSPEQYFAQKFDRAADKKCDMSASHYPNVLSGIIQEYL